MSLLEYNIPQKKQININDFLKLEIKAGRAKKCKVEII